MKFLKITYIYLGLVCSQMVVAQGPEVLAALKVLAKQKGEASSLSAQEGWLVYIGSLFSTIAQDISNEIRRAPDAWISAHLPLASIIEQATGEPSKNWQELRQKIKSRLATPDGFSAAIVLTAGEVLLFALIVNYWTGIAFGHAAEPMGAKDILAKIMGEYAVLPAQLPAAAAAA